MIDLNINLDELDIENMSLIDLTDLNLRLVEAITNKNRELVQKVEDLTIVNQRLKLKQRNDELQAKLDKHEEYGGVIDEGRAWAKEAMDKRVLLKDIKDFCNDQNLKYDTTACTILEMINKAFGEKSDED